VQCASCAYPNDMNFKFCQSCGNESECVGDSMDGGSAELGIDVSGLDERLRILEDNTTRLAYVKRKQSLKTELESFLKGTSKRGITTASPEDIKRFLVWKDRNGKTQVHVIDCAFLGKIGIHGCDCPKRLAAGTVQSLTGKLKTIFNPFRGTVWNEIHKTGNPVVSTTVREYVKAIVKEQARSRVQVKQATPLFTDKLLQVVSFIDGKIETTGLKAHDRYIFARDQAFFKIQFFSGSRAGDLCSTLVQDVKRLRDGSGLVFIFTMGKTLGNGKKHEFCTLKMDCKELCPVAGLDRYFDIAKGLGIDLSTGFLFRTISMDRSGVSDEPVSYSVMYGRLKHYLDSLGINDGETPHGLRGGCAVTLALAGHDKGDIMRHIGWESEASFNRYSRLQTMMSASVIPSVLVDSVESGGNMAKKIFTDFGNLLDLPPAFKAE
jgi:integrase